ncbi:MAG: LemA family protein [Flammeovirgaceae bacterium]|nr:LemA family protein [Flammeovirgaceae bacterium]MBE62024.1 LemA family protein [Flammeovirgaceae bacterium]HCX23169.1 LemA family protein [Cytophagales bacterium]|tara:strand:- start:2541 stop:3131 length:591 start_codon:yes stop_codon:yes gene_type:complete
MNKKWITIIVVVVVIFFIYNFFTGKYNNMVNKDEAVNTEWSNVETQYQRRNDLIPNLVNTVKGFANQEKEVLVGVTEARSKASSINLDASNLTAENMQQFQAAQGQLNSALSRLLVTVEKYPELKSNQNFLELQAQLEGTENRIAVSRKRFNEVTQDYNTYIRTFPNSMIAGWGGFERKPLFEAEEGAEKAPEVQF